jgi:hypothetical protein
MDSSSEVATMVDKRINKITKRQIMSPPFSGRLYRTYAFFLGPSSKALSRWRRLRLGDTVVIFSLLVDMVWILGGNACVGCRNDIVDLFK